MHLPIRAAICAALLATAPAAADHSEFIRLRHGSALLHLPAVSTGRLPLVVILHDASQEDGRTATYVARLLDAGLAVMQSLDDVLGAAALLDAIASHPALDNSRIGVLGFGSRGQEAAGVPGRYPVRAMLYLGCGGLAQTGPGRVLLLLHGSDDPANAAAACHAAAAAWRMTGATVQHVAHDHTNTDWDFPVAGSESRLLLQVPERAGRLRVHAWPDLAELSAGDVASFFARGLAGEGP